jgi:hypothetical protein
MGRSADATGCRLVISTTRKPYLFWVFGLHLERVCGRFAGMFRGAAALAEAVDDCDVAATGEAIVEARRIRDRLDALIATAEVEFVRAGGHEVEGHATYGSFLRARCGASTSESRRIASRTKKLCRWPEILDAWNVGVLCGAQVDVISAAVPDRHVERFAIEAADYLEPLEYLGADVTRGVVVNWTGAADDAVQSEAVEAGEEPVEEVPQRTMAASRIIDDRLEVTGSFDKDAAAAIEDALRAATRPDEEDETRSPLQRRADALVEICRFYVAHHQQPPNSGRPDRGVIVADVAALFRAILRGDGVHTAAQLETYLDAQPELGALERGLFCDAFDGAGGSARTLDGHTVTDTLLRHVATNGILERLLRTGHRIIDHGDPPASSPNPRNAPWRRATPAPESPESRRGGATPTTHPPSTTAAPPTSTTATSRPDANTSTTTAEDSPTTSTPTAPSPSPHPTAPNTTPDHPNGPATAHDSPSTPPQRPHPSCPSASERKPMPTPPG